MRVREHAWQKIWPQMRQWCRRLTIVNGRSHFVQLRHFASSAQCPEIVSCCGAMLDGDQLLDVVDTDENECVRDWRDGLMALMPRARLVGKRGEEGDVATLEVDGCGRTHIPPWLASQNAAVGAPHKAPANLGRLVYAHECGYRGMDAGKSTRFRVKRPAGGTGALLGQNPAAAGAFWARGHTRWAIAE
jgi:hypothetical protein